MRLVNVVPVVIHVLDSVTKNLEKWFEKLQVDANIDVVKKSCRERCVSIGKFKNNKRKR